MLHNTEHTMPAHDRPIHFNLPPRKSEKNAVAAVLVFDCSPDELERVNAFIEKLKERGIVRSGHAAAYDNNVTSAELYFP